MSSRNRLRSLPVLADFQSAISKPTCFSRWLFSLAAADTSKPAMERTLEGFRGFTSCLTGAREMGVVYGTGAWNMGEIKGNPAMQEAYQLGKSI